MASSVNVSKQGDMRDSSHVQYGSQDHDEEDALDCLWSKGLARRITIDAASAVIAGSAVSPLVTIIDRAVAEASAGRATLLESARSSFRNLFLCPHHFVTHRVFHLMVLLYGSTYFTSNTIDTITSLKTESSRTTEPPTTSSNGVLKFGAVSAVNMSLSLYKDSQLTRIFGTITTRPLPPASYALLTLRDFTSIFASFNLPPMVAPLLPQSLDSTFGRLAIAQLAIPALMQPINAPLHLLGLDLYNRHQKLPWRERWKKVRGEWKSASLARMCRVVPPFGFGNVINHGLRERLLGNEGNV